MNADKYKKFKYFLDCYIVIAESDIGVLETIQEFKKSESETTMQALINELLEIQKRNKWEEIQRIIIEHSSRSISR
ncbi:hypothetical protein [Paenibacillus sp. Z6-24]